MGKLKIQAYHYNTICDTYGCNNMAKVSLIKEGAPIAGAHNICQECLDDIRGTTKPTDEPTEADTTKDEQIPFDEVIEPTKADMDDLKAYEDAPTPEQELLDTYSYKELQDLAKELDLQYVGIKTEVLRQSIADTLTEGE